jgi:ATPase complex subunit ATP10
VQVAVANKVIIPAMEAVKFPDIKVSFSDGTPMKLPIRISDNKDDSDKSSVPKASLVCLSFRASSQVMNHSRVL